MVRDQGIVRPQNTGTADQTVAILVCDARRRSALNTPSMYKKLPAPKAFKPVMQTYAMPRVLVVSNSVPATALPEPVAHLKASPGVTRLFDSVAAIAGQVRGGSLHALAVTTVTRSTALPVCRPWPRPA